jgi:hypothetical protein
VSAARRATSPVATAALALTVVASALWLVLGPRLSIAGRVVVVVAAFGGFACLLVVCRRGHGPTARPVLAAVIVALAVAVVTPPRGSNDVWSYVMYGRVISQHAGNPYVDPPSDYPSDPFLARVSSGWRGTASVYGPAFVAGAAFGTALAGSSPVANRAFFQLVAAAALLAAMALLWRRTRDVGALVFLGLNPALLAVVNGGHNDLVVGAALLASVLLARDRRAFAAGIAAAAAVLVKLVVILAVVALAVWMWRRYGRALATRMVLTVGGVVTTAYLAFGLHGLDAVRAASAHTSRSNVFNLPVRLVTGGSALLPHEGSIALVLMGATIVVLLVTLPREAAPASVAGAALLVFMFGAAYVLPWYVAWALPVLALVWRSLVATVAALHSAVLTLAYTGRATHGLLPAYTHYVVPAFLAAGLLYLVLCSCRRVLHPLAV